MLPKNSAKHIARQNLTNAPHLRLALKKRALKFLLAFCATPISSYRLALKPVDARCYLPRPTCYLHPE